MNASSLGQKLLAWREKRGLTQEQVGDLLGDVTAPTVGRWEKGQRIPGPVTICLEWLVEGKVPFQALSVPKNIRDEVLKVSMDLGAWERLDALRIVGGYASVTDMIGGWIHEELAKPEESWNEADMRTGDQAPLDGVALAAEVTIEAGAGGGDDVSAHADAAAAAFEKQHPLPPAGAAGAPAGTTGARRDVIYKRPQGTSGTGIRKR